MGNTVHYIFLIAIYSVIFHEERKNFKFPIEIAIQVFLSSFSPLTPFSIEKWAPFIRNKWRWHHNHTWSYIDMLNLYSLFPLHRKFCRLLQSAHVWFLFRKIRTVFGREEKERQGGEGGYFSNFALT